MGDLSIGTGNSSYHDYARRGQLFIATANVTSPVIYTTAAGTGGPLLWNNSGAAAGGTSRVMAVLLALGVGITTVSGAASALGLTGGATTAPTSTTAIDAVNNCLIGGPAPRCSLYRVGTVSAAGTFFMPTHTLDTAAATAQPLGMSWVDLHGCFIVQPGNFASVAAAATATSAVLSVGLIWAEIPY